jgi:protein ERP2
VVVGNDDPLAADAAKHHQTFTQVETSMINNHDALRRVIDLQTHHRMREANHRYTAEFMNERVQLVSAAEALMLVILSICQIVYLKSLFSSRPNKVCNQPTNLAVARALLSFVFRLHLGLLPVRLRSLLFLSPRV